jgi:hypothetical protein
MTAGLLSGLAIVVSVLAAIIAWRASVKANRLQGRVVELEEARERDRITEQSRANVSAVITQFGAGNVPNLVVMNAGPAPARSVWVLIDGVTPQMHQQFRKGDDLLGRDLGPGGRMGIALRVHDGMQRMFDVRLRWSDGTGDDRTWESTLTL